MYSYEDICRETGVKKTTIKELSYLIKEGNATGNNSKREFTEEEYLKILELAFYFKLKYSVKEIEKAKNNFGNIVIKDFDEKINELTKERDELTKQRNELDKTIQIVELIKEMDIDPSAFFTEKWFKYCEGKVANDKSGIFDMIYLISNEEINNYYNQYLENKEKEINKLIKYFEFIIEKYNKGYKYEDDEVQRIFLRLYKYYIQNIIPISIPIDLVMPIFNNSFKDNSDYSANTVKYIVDGYTYFTENNKITIKYHNSIIEQCVDLVSKIIELGYDGYKKDDKSVLNIVSKLSNLVKKNTRLEYNDCMMLLNIFEKILLQNEEFMNEFDADIDKFSFNFVYESILEYKKGESESESERSNKNN